MLIGKMDKWITILKPVGMQDGQGGRTREWVTASQTWASMKIPRNFRNSTPSVEGAVTSDLNYEFTLRRNSQIEPGWQVSYNGKVYNILHAYDGDDNSTVVQAHLLTKRA